MNSIHVNVSLQTMSVLDESGTILKTYPISTGAKGEGFDEGSNMTPTGHFVIREKIGEGAKQGTIFQARQPIGIWEENMDNQADFILTRILRLDGQDEENKNTYERYIYIHGTNREDLLGTKSSHGCIRMGNADIEELFELMSEGNSVIIA